MSRGVPKEYAARTVCWPHSKRCTKSLEEITGESDSLRGKFLGNFYSDCEVKLVNWGCKYSHTIFNTKRILRLGAKSPNFVVQLDYGYGFERYGTYDGWTDGWNIIVNETNCGSKGRDEKTYNLPKSLLLAEHKQGIKTFNFKSNADGKVQSICRSNNDRGFCKFKTRCRYDHDLVDSKRLERLVRWADEGMSPNRDYMTIEYRVEGDKAPAWKITLKPDAFAKLNLGSNPIEEIYEDSEMERVVGSKK